ncbi:MAG: hypothetical protein M1838_005466 [Thelocarpon superellum]|nr:MAG: hypothetical protein M1838_005466 [Thelocarpon superellum]
MDVSPARQQTPVESSTSPLAPVLNPPSKPLLPPTASPLWDSELGELSPAGPLIKSDRRPLKRLKRKAASASLSLDRDQATTPVLRFPRASVTTAPWPEPVRRDASSRRVRSRPNSALSSRRPSSTMATRSDLPPPTRARPIEHTSPPATMDRIPFQATSRPAQRQWTTSDFVIAESPWSSSPDLDVCRAPSSLSHPQARHGPPVSPPRASFPHAKESDWAADRFSASVYSVSPRASVEYPPRQMNENRLRRSSDSRVELGSGAGIATPVAPLPRLQQEAGSASTEGSRPGTPQRAIFHDLPTAHSSITTRSQGLRRLKSLETIEPYKMHLPSSPASAVTGPGRSWLDAAESPEDRAEAPTFPLQPPAELADAFFGAPSTDAEETDVSVETATRAVFMATTAHRQDMDETPSSVWPAGKLHDTPPFRVALVDAPMDDDFDDDENTASCPPAPKSSAIFSTSHADIAKRFDGQHRVREDSRTGAVHDGETGLGTFDFGLVPHDLRRPGLRETMNISPRTSLVRGHAPPSSPSGQPPTSPLPPPPPSSSPRPAVLFSRHNSTSVEGLSHHSSYGDTRVLLDLPSQSTIAEPKTTDSDTEASTGDLPRLPQASPLGERSTNVPRPSPANTFPQYLKGRPELQRGHSSQSSNGIPTRVTRTVTPRHQVERITRNLTNAASVAATRHLDAEIDSELRRFAGLNSALHQRSSLIVYNENANNADHGADHHSSSRDSSGHLESMVSDDSGHGPSESGFVDEESGVPPARPATLRRPITDKGSFAASLPSTRGSRSGSGSGSGSGSDHSITLPETHHEDEDGDWETIDEGRLSRAGTRMEMTHGTTGSSLANYSSYASLGPEGRELGFLRDSQLFPHHPADNEYEHVYRVQETMPDGTPVLLPHYNTLTKPAPAHHLSNKLYRHPSPLSQDHVHPFKSSPPVVMGSTQTLLRPSTPPYDPTSRLPSRLSRPAGATESSLIELYRPFGSSSDDALRAAADERAFRLRNGSNDHPNTYRAAGSSPSSIWMDAFSESVRNLPDSSAVPGANGSFAKVTLLGPKANITGTPEGTGMRQVGSSLADASSPGIMWSSSSPGHDTTPTLDRIEAAPAQPPAAHLELDEAAAPAKQQPGVLYEQIRAHRDLLAAEGLLPRAFTPSPARPPSRRGGRPLSFLSLRSSLLNPSPAAAKRLTEFPSYEPFCINPTPRLPTPRDSEAYLGFDYHLYRQTREGSSTRASTYHRKRILSRSILALCLLFPPLLLLYGYGMLDVMISSLTSGDVTSLGRREKKVALVAGWALAVGAVIGIVVSMIVVGIGK